MPSIEEAERNAKKALMDLAGPGAVGMTVAPGGRLLATNMLRLAIAHKIASEFGVTFAKESDLVMAIVKDMGPTAMALPIPGPFDFLLEVLPPLKLPMALHENFAFGEGVIRVMKKLSPYR